MTNEYLKPSDWLVKSAIPNYPATDLALSIPCPVCGVDEERPCVYVWPKGVAECKFWEDSDICFRHSDSQHDRIAKVGTPTKTPHSSRKGAVFKRKLRERQHEEWEKLRRWFAEYGDIFEE